MRSSSVATQSEFKPRALLFTGVAGGHFAAQAALHGRLHDIFDLDLLFTGPVRATHEDRQRQRLEQYRTVCSTHEEETPMTATDTFLNANCRCVGVSCVDSRMPVAKPAVIAATAAGRSPKVN